MSAHKIGGATHVTHRMRLLIALIEGHRSRPTSAVRPSRQQQQRASAQATEVAGTAGRHAHELGSRRRQGPPTEGDAAGGA
jgi:hypothetical protein